MGIPHDSPQRVKAGLQLALSEASEDGHCYLPEAELIAKGVELLGVETALAETCLEELAQDEGVVMEYLPGPEGEVAAVYLVPFHRAEVSLANGLLRLLQAPVERLPAFRNVNWEAALGWLQKTTGSTLAPEQEQAVRLALTERVAVLTGGPGCGKSFTVRSIVALARAKTAKIILAARRAGRPSASPSWPSSRPARCTASCSSGPLATPSTIATIRSTPISSWWMWPACSTCCSPTRWSRPSRPARTSLFVGYVDQLPGVGAGEVLRDLLGSGVLPSVRPTHIFRQAQHSGADEHARMPRLTCRATSGDVCYHAAG
jgi:exodeoxyribonuclease V alpha subunit